MYDITKTILIIILFYAFFNFQYLTSYLNQFQTNYPKYRCNPLVMPFVGLLGHDPAQNFAFCIQTIQTTYMTNFTEPLYYLGNGFTSLIGDITQDIQFVRQKIFSLVSNISNIIESIYGLFVNIILAFQHNFIKLKDMLAKMIGMLISIVYILDGMYLSGMSIWNGPVGKTLRMVCFHPETKIKLKNGNIKLMKEVIIDDVLENGSKVYGILKLKGNNSDDNDNDDINNIANNPYYKIFSKELNEYIYVTGSHLIRDNTGCFIPVSKFEKSLLDKNLKSEFMSCLITDDHLIKIGEYTFWDWED